MSNLAGLLRVLREHPDAAEADLSRWYGIDYRDRWRFDPDGVRRLTLRMIHVRLRHLPADSALARLERDGDPVWLLEHHLLDDLRMVTETGVSGKKAKPHPSRRAALQRAVATKPVDPGRARKIADARRRARARRATPEGG